MAIRAVILDIGGVLEHNPRTGWQERWSATLGLPRGAVEGRLRPIFAAGSLGRIALEQVHEQVAAALALDGEHLHRLMDDIWREYLGTLNHEMRSHFASLRPGFRTGILSNSFVGAREREEAAYGFGAICDAIVYSHEVGLMKPDLRIYRLACARVGARPHETVFVDDVRANVDAAASLGMCAIHFESTGQAIAALDRACQSPCGERDPGRHPHPSSVGGLGPA